MYDLVCGDGGLHVMLDGGCVLGGARLSLSLDDGTTVELAPMSGVPEPCAGPDCDVIYRDEGETVEVELGLRMTDSTLVVSAAVKWLRLGIGVRPVGLAVRGGLRIALSSLGEVDGLMASYLHKDWWTRPHFDHDLATLPARTQSLVWRTGDCYHHLMCICDDAMKAELEGTSDGAVLLASAYAGGYTNIRTTLFVLTSGADPFDLPERNAAAGMAALGTPRQLREQKRYPEMLEYLGWCSWDAFRREVSADGLLAKAAELAEKALPVRWFIVDDGWLSNDETRLDAFQPDPGKFPDGLAPVVDALKSEHGLWWVGVWHTLMGYWAGVLPESDLTTRYAGALATMHSGAVLPAADATKAFGFWDAWHSALRGAGIDFVKVDYQSGLVTFWQPETAIGAVAKAAHQALEASVGLNFDNAMINCMGMAIENIWHRPASSVTRNSDDFFPNREGSFAEHALQNAYNAYYHAPFMWLDWDMWWSEHEHAAAHAVLRAVSGGPVYVSDRVGATDPAQLRPLALSDGRLLRCDLPGMATKDCLLVDPSQQTVPLKVWNRAGDIGVVATVNVHSEGSSVCGTVGPSDVSGLIGESFVAYEVFSRHAEAVTKDGTLPVALDAKGCALYLFVPRAPFVSPIGLADKYIGCAAIADWFTTPERTTVVLLEGGRFAWFSEQPPSKVSVNGETVSWEVDACLYTVDCAEHQGSVWVEIEHGRVAC